MSSLMTHRNQIRPFHVYFSGLDFASYYDSFRLKSIFVQVSFVCLTSPVAWRRQKNKSSQLATYSEINWVFFIIIMSLLCGLYKSNWKLNMVVVVEEVGFIKNLHRGSLRIVRKAGEQCRKLSEVFLNNPDHVTDEDVTTQRCCVFIRNDVYNKGARLKAFQNFHMGLVGPKTILLHFNEIIWAAFRICCVHVSWTGSAHTCLSLEEAAAPFVGWGVKTPMAQDRVWHLIRPQGCTFCKCINKLRRRQMVWETITKSNLHNPTLFKTDTTEMLEHGGANSETES